MSEWISTKDAMPENAKFVLAWCRTEHGVRILIRAFYAKQYSVEANDADSDWFEYDPADETESTPWLPAGWYESNYYEETNWHVNGEVTHWMHLPPPPQDKGE